MLKSLTCIWCDNTFDSDVKCLFPVVEFDIQSGGDAAAAATSQTVEIPGSDGVQQQSDPEERRSSSGSQPASAEDQEEVLTRTSSNASLDSWAEFEARNFHEAFLSAGEAEDEDWA